MVRGARRAQSTGDVANACRRGEVNRLLADLIHLVRDLPAVGLFREQNLSVNVIDQRAAGFDQEYSLIAADVSAGDASILQSPVNLLGAIVEIRIELSLLFLLGPDV